jgi:nucleoporin NUP1
MFKTKPKRPHAPILMHTDKNEKPRLGRSKGREVNGAKPYAGEGGMKKLLARRKQEEEEERKQEKADAMDDGRVEEDEMPAKKMGRSYRAEANGGRADSVTNKPLQQDTPLDVLPATTFRTAVSSPANYEQSSLRVGRMRTSRNHIARPTSRSNNRFSAAYDEEESDDQMVEEKSVDQIALEEAAKKVPVFEVPAGFSFGKEVSIQKVHLTTMIYLISQMPQIQHDLTTAKEPPMSSLPFSFPKPGATNGTPASSVSPPLSVTKQHVQPLNPPSSISAQLPPSGPQALSITLTTATPEPPKMSIPEVPAAGLAIPNFFEKPEPLKRPPSATPPTAGSEIPNSFANFPASSKATSALVSPPPMTSSVPNFFANSVAVNKPISVTPPQLNAFTHAHATPTKDAENPLWEGEEIEKPAATVPETKTLLLGNVSKPSSSFGVQPTGTNEIAIFNAGSGTSHPTSIFASSAPAVSVKDVEIAPTAPVFGAVTPSKPTELTSSPFSFGTPAKADESMHQPAAAPEPPKVPDTAPAPVEVAKPPPLFGSAPVSSFVGFGGSTAGTTTTEASKPSFSFGQPNHGASTPMEAPKPLFGSDAAGGFLFSQRPSSAPAPELRSSSANPFSFGAVPSTPPAGGEKKAPFTFGPSPVAAAPAASTGFSFGPPSGSSHGTDVSHKPFAFGNTGAAPVRPVTPPKSEQEFRMEESPTREMNGKGADAPKSVLGGFSFGAPTTSSTGSALFGQNNQSVPGGSTPFSFGGAPSTPMSNPFAAQPEKQDNKGLGFSGFGQNTSSSGFSFGQKSADAVPTTTPAVGGFSFGQPPVVAPVNTSTSFSFGPSNNGNSFSQSTPNVGSTPNSPSTFNQSTPFSFTSPTAPSNPFAFGSSQPTSPATNGNTSLPQAPGTPGGGFTFGQSNAPQGTSPFQAPPATLPPISGSLFTIGSAPPPAPTGGGRAMKKLPNRRAGKREKNYLIWSHFSDSTTLL